MPVVRIQLDGLSYRGGPRRHWDEKTGELINQHPIATIETDPDRFVGPVIVDRKEYPLRAGAVTLPQWAAEILVRYWGFRPQVNHARHHLR